MSSRALSRYAAGVLQVRQEVHKGSLSLDTTSTLILLLWTQLRFQAVHTRQSNVPDRPVVYLNERQLEGRLTKRQLSTEALVEEDSRQAATAQAL